MSSSGNNENNHNKINLFELKHNQNKYSQLIETQTPEPQDNENEVVGVGGEKQLKRRADSIQVPMAGTSGKSTRGSKDEKRKKSSLTTSKQSETSQSLKNCPASTSGQPQQVTDVSAISSDSNSNKTRAQAIKKARKQMTQAMQDVSESGGSSLTNNKFHSNKDELTAGGSSRCGSTQSASQMSTSFVSTLSVSQMNRCNSVDFNGTASNISFNEPTNLNRTISQSMLQLETDPKRLSRFEVSWNELSFTYKPSLLASLKQGRLNETHVLTELSGHFESNQLVAVIGPSGCGKTTLLHFLAGNNQANEQRLRIVGLEEPKVAFIGQGDCLLPGLTARETLYYASRLQNSSPNFNHQAHIETIIKALGLSECGDRNVTKLSGGQAKRVSIGQELLYPTNLLILDEVTSGLDASTSYSIVKLLKQLVSDESYPMSIVMSIHQPSAKLFSVFDQVYVMSEGCCLYEGSCQVDVVNDYLSQFCLECPKFHNIADYLIEISSDDLNFKPVKEQMIKYQRNKQIKTSETIITAPRKHKLLSIKTKSGNNINKNYLIKSKFGSHNIHKSAVDVEKGEELDPLNNLLNDENEEEDYDLGDNTYEENVDEDNDDDDDEEEDEESQKVSLVMSNSLYAAVEQARARRLRPLGSHFLSNFSRSMLRIRRSYILTYLQFITYILLGLQLSTFYGSGIGKLDGCPRLPISFIAFVFSQDSDIENLSFEMRRIQENMNFLLVAIMTATFAALEITVITFPLEAKTVKREWRNGWYRVSSYFLGRTLADLPFQIAFVVAFCAVIYTMTGQIGLFTWRFGSFVTVMVMTALVAQTVGFIFGALFMDNLPAAVFTAPLCIFPALLFSGFFSRVSHIPTFYKPMTYLSHFRYAFEALIVTLYGYDRCQCDQAALDTYHESLHNQTSAIKTMFTSLFGTVDCGSVSTPAVIDENSIEDTSANPLSDLFGAASQAPHESLMNMTTAALSTSTSRAFETASSIKPLEDALVDSVFEHMVRGNDSNEHDGSAMDQLVRKFSSRVTTMLNSQSNFGHQVPQKCQQFSSYLMTEFELHNDDLMIGLGMLIISVLVTRLVCNAILTFTIATRTN